MLTKTRTIKCDGGGITETYPVAITWKCPHCNDTPRPHPFVGDLHFISYDYRYKMEKLKTDNDVSRRKEWKPCQHYKIVADRGSYPYRVYPLFYDWGYFHTYKSLKGMPVWWLLAGNSVFRNTFGQFGEHINGLSSLYNASAKDDEDFISLPPNFDALKDNAVNALFPRIKAELSLINSIIELKDLRSLPRTLRLIKGFFARVPQTLKRLSSTPKKYRSYRHSYTRDIGNTLHEGFRTGSDSYLQLQFGIMPLLADICGLWSAIRRTQKRINDLLNREGKVQMKHFTCSIPSPSDSTISSSWLGPLSFTDAQFSDRQMIVDEEASGYLFEIPFYQLLARRESRIVEQKFHMQIEYNYHFTQFQRSNAELLGFLDAFGVNLNPSIIWNAIPFSFVVDWLVNLNRWFDSTKVMNLEPQTNIRRALWSYTVKRQTKTWVKSPVVEWINNVKVPEHSCMNLNETAYRRELGIPTSSSLVTSGLSSRELSLGAAMLYPKRWRPRWTLR